MPSSARIAKLVRLVGRSARKSGVKAYFMGRYPMLVAIGKPLSDTPELEVVTSSVDDAKKLSEAVRKASPGGYEEVSRSGLSVTAMVDGVDVYFQAAPQPDELAPFLRMWGISGTPVASEAFGRWFTIESLAIPAGSNEIVDVTRRGMNDAGRMMVCSIMPATKVVARHPLMITRAVALASKYNLAIEGPLWKAMLDNAHSVHDLPPARMAIEAFVLSRLPRSARILKELGLEDMMEDFMNKEKGGVAPR